MALESTSPPLSAIYKDTDEVHDVMDSVTSTGVTTTGLWSNATKKMKCAIGEDITQRITVVSVIMICTIVGNLALILTLTCKRSRRIKRVNVFLINLAIGDLAVALFTNTTEILFLAFGDWALGPAACKISVYMQMVTLASATFLLTAMSMDRYQVIVRPLESLAQRPRIWMKVTTAWVMAFLFATPQLFIFLQVTENHDGVDRRCCVSKGYSEEWQRKAYLSFLTSYILLIPTALMIFCYANIIHVVWIRARAEGAGQHVHQQTETEQCAGSPRMSMRRGLVTASKRRVITMTLTVVAGFVLCQTPYFMVSLIRVYSDYRIKLPALLSLSEHIVLMHSTLNPLLYGLFTLRGYHITAAIRCLSCKDVPVLQAENDHLLRGKTTAGKTASKRLTSRSCKGQIYQEATGDGTSQTDVDQVSDGATNGPCTQKENHHRPARYLSDRTSGGAKEINDHEGSSPIQLMLLANHSLVKGSVETASNVGCGQAPVQAETPGVVRDRVPSVRWGETTHIVMPRTSDPQPSPPALTSASWTATSWNSKNECPSCV